MSNHILPQIGDFLSAFAQGRQGSDVRQQRITQNLLGGIQDLPQGQVLTSPEFQQLQLVNPEEAAAIGDPLRVLNQEQQQALFTDALRGDKLLEADFPGKAAELFQNRINEIDRAGRDSSDTREILNALINEGPEAARRLLEPTLIMGRIGGFLPTDPTISALDQARIVKLTAEAGQITEPKTPSSKERAETRKIEAETNKIIKETERTTGIKLGPIETEEQKATVKVNVKRIAELSQASRTRQLAIDKANTFLTAFETGGAQSGAGRTAASFIPGVFTKQGQFDEELDAFAEIAAREKLKAVGEIRPTDADVEGMKRALFGVGRDEQTNINLLKQFIQEQESLGAELGALNRAKRTGDLATFTGAPVTVGRFTVQEE